MAFISVPLKIEELGGVTRDTRNEQYSSLPQSILLRVTAFGSNLYQVGKMVELDR